MKEDLNEVWKYSAVLQMKMDKIIYNLLTMDHDDYDGYINICRARVDSGWLGQEAHLPAYSHTSVATVR